MSEDALFLLQAFGVGAAITFLYDWLRILRRVVPHRQLAVSLEDLLFWIFCAIQVFLWMYRVTNGGMRWFAVAGALVGIWLYKSLCSSLFVNILSRLVTFLWKGIARILKFFLTPFFKMGIRMNTMAKRMGKKRRKIMGNFKIWLKSFCRALKIRVCKK